MLTSGSKVSIFISGKAAYNAVATRFLHGRIDMTTEKAVKVVMDDRSSVWIPKAALKASGDSFALAPWFMARMAMADWSKIERNLSIGGVAA